MSDQDVRRALADRYALERELGRGGMGAVYLARDLRLDRMVALKVLPAEYRANPDLHERFLRETRTAASFSHPNIVPVHAVEDRDGVLAYAMGYVEGESLAQRVQRAGPLPVRDLVRMLQDVGYALAYAHGRGVVHRDIKPDNIMLERATGRALLMDFGIARGMAAAPAAGLTRVGEVVGTPEYMSPEQATGDTVDGRSDLYSLGLVAWFAATGRVAMAAESTQRILVKQLTEPVPPIESVRPELPDLLSAAIDRCIAKAPEARFQAAEELVEAVDNSQLAGPDVPLPVRTYMHELETLTLVLFFIATFGWMFVRLIGARMSTLDAMLPAVLLLGIAVTRVLQVMNEARQLAEHGFSAAEVLRGMEGVFLEREGVRMARRNDPVVAARRRRTVRQAVVMLAIAATLVYAASRTRIPNPAGGWFTPPSGIFMVFTGLGLLGAGIVLLVKSPFRAPVTERWFRRLWMGPIGRAFLGIAGRGVAHAPGATLSPITAVPRVTPAPRATPTPASVPAPPPLATLEQRVAALEAWRREQSRPEGHD